MTLRLVVLALAAAALVPGGRVSAAHAGTAAFGAPPLTDEQLDQLRKIDAWQITFNSVTRVRHAGANFDEAFDEDFGIEAVVSGPPGCRARSCFPNYETAPVGHLSEGLFLNEERDIPDCIVNADGSRSDGHQSWTLQRSINQTIVFDGSPGNNGRPKRFDNGTFSIDDGPNPPQAEAFIDTTEFVGTQTFTRVGCLANSNENIVLTDTPSIEFTFDDRPEDERGVGGGDTQVRVENGEFIVRGQFHRVNVGIACRTSFLGGCMFGSRSEETTVTWEARPTCVKRDLHEADGPDTDGDALPDCWERKGYDADEDGNVDVDLHAMGADPLHKDVFVEIDAMTGRNVPDAATDSVESAFAAAPVPNPDGKTGVALHVDNGSTSTMNPATGAKWGQLSESTDALPAQPVLGSFVPLVGLYLWGDFDAIKDLAFNPARVPIFHYAVSVERFGSASTTNTGISRNLPASDFIVSLMPATATEAAGTVMHELGHNLGLHHGGGDELNYKPNYLSVMNYSFQFGGLSYNGQPGKLDYSRFGLPGAATPETLPRLDEHALDEQVGFGVAAGTELAKYATLYKCGKDDPGFHSTPLVGGVDWSCDLSTQGIATANINGDKGVLGFEAFDVLEPYDDWVNLVYNGGAIGDVGGSLQLPSETPNDEVPVEELRVAERALQGDSVAPATTASFSPEPNSAGWNRADVNVTLSAADDPGGSGVREIVVLATGAESIAEHAVVGASATLTIDGEGETTVTFFARDNAGNAEEPHSLVVRLDKTVPVLRCSASPDLLWPPDHRLVDVAVSVDMQDALSGPAGFELRHATSSEPQGAAPDVVGFLVGTPDIGGRLRAERRGDGPGRTYSLGYRGLDEAGNTGTCAAVARVPHDRGR